MSCPYCLAFTPSGPAPARSGGSAALQQRRSEQNRTLVKAYWEFEEGENRWLGFSPKVSVLLEARYNVDYTTLLEEGQRQSQRIRRVGVTADESSESGNAKGFCTVDPTLWSEMQRELQELKEEQEWLLQLLRGRNGSKDRLDELDLRVRGAYGPLAEEVARLWRRLDDAEAAVRSAAQAAQQAEASGKQLLAGESILPGRLLHASPISVLGVTRSVEGGEVLVLPGGEDAPEFLKAQDVRTSPLGVLARPGSKVWYVDQGIEKAGVVCGPPLEEPRKGPSPSASVDGFCFRRKNFHNTHVARLMLCRYACILQVVVGSLKLCNCRCAAAFH
ncbi:unnamed protein product [Symbiodinium pilosum]|uniref:WWE domain-containing protein n=1 Tax=Symbiodinium pilosum TaxID=2952 RepID=A0A812R2D1_SYMPI|nr:unnamed protein product [Symbiodinium pilosum]